MLLKFILQFVLATMAASIPTDLDPSNVNPKHLTKRFRDLLAKFMIQDPVDTTGQLSLVNGIFCYGNVEVNHLALIRRAQAAAPIRHRAPEARIDIEESLVFVGYVLLLLYLQGAGC